MELIAIGHHHLHSWRFWSRPLAALVPFGVLSALIAASWLLSARCPTGGAAGGLGATVTWDGRGYAIAWAEADSRGWSQVLAARFTPEDGSFSRPSNVGAFRGLLAAPELVANDRGYLMFLDQGPAGIGVMALSNSFRPRERANRAQILPHTAGARATLCRAPIWSGLVHGVGVGVARADGRITYHLMLLTADGDIESVYQIGRGHGGTPACALALRHGDFVMAFAPGRGHGALALAGLTSSGETFRIESAWPGLQAHASSPVPMRLVVDDLDAYRLLYRHEGESRARVLYMNWDGEPVSDHELDPRITGETTDMGAGAISFVLGWARSDGVELAMFDNDAHEWDGWQSPRGRSPSQPRMVTRDSECAMVWTESGGDNVWIVVAPMSVLGGAQAGNMAMGRIQTP